MSCWRAWHIDPESCSIEDLGARASTLSTQREQRTEQLAALPGPRRRLGREHDPTSLTVPTTQRTPDCRARASRDADRVLSLGGTPWASRSSVRRTRLPQ